MDANSKGLSPHRFNAGRTWSSDRNGVPVPKKRTLSAWGAVACTAILLALAACGGGGGGPETGGSMPPDTGSMPPDGGQDPIVSEPVPELVLPPAQAAGAQQAPVIQLGDELRVGAMPPPEQSDPASVATHDGAAVRYGRLMDGVGATALTSYLSEDARLTRDNILRFAEAPVVRYVAGTTAAQIDEIVRAVQLLNANLPRDFQLTVDPTPVSAADDAAGDDHDTLARGQILVEYDRREDWEIPYHGNPIGNSNTWSSGGAVLTARVCVDHTRHANASGRMVTLVHELIRALDRQHADPARFPSTIMHVIGVGTQGYVMHQLDREALLAVYSVLEPGDTLSDIAAGLGPWESRSLHVRGDLDDLAFGASLRNGLVRPWALGPRPGIDLADNQELMGSASWYGRLLGLTPSGATVAGAAGLAIDLASLDGDLDFTSLETWTGTPGALGSGTMWGDGDLTYDIAVEGNVFARTGGTRGRSPARSSVPPTRAWAVRSSAPTSAPASPEFAEPGLWMATVRAAALPGSYCRSAPPHSTSRRLLWASPFSISSVPSISRPICAQPAPAG